MVQVGHVCLEAGRRFSWDDHAYMVVFGVKDLESTRIHLETHDIEYSVFYEPDDDMGYTAICTAPVSGEQRKIFKKFSLWK